MLLRAHQRLSEVDGLKIQVSYMTLERVDTFKYLRVQVDNTLSWRDHVR